MLEVKSEIALSIQRVKQAPWAVPNPAFRLGIFGLIEPQVVAANNHSVDSVRKVSSFSCASFEITELYRYSMEAGYPFRN